MPLIVDVLTEDDIRAYVSDRLSPLEAEAVETLIRNDPRARRIFLAIEASHNDDRADRNQAPVSGGSASRLYNGEN